MNRTALLLSSLLLSFTSASGLRAGEIEVIFTEIPGDPTAVVPGALDANGLPLVTEFKALEDLVVSPDGTQWLLKARNTAGSDLETLLVLGSGTSGTTLAQEGQPVAGGQPGELYDFFDPVAGFNDAGDYAFGARAKNGDSTIKEKVIKFDGTFTVVVAESTPALGLMDLPPDPSGDELFGNSLNSIHLLNDGSVGFAAITIQNIHSSRRPAIFYDDTAFRQSGVSAVGGGVWDSFDSNDFRTTPDGTTWLAQGDDEGSTATDDILVVNDVVELREGSMIAGSTVTVAAIFDTKLAANGDWFSRGDDPADDDWAVRNGEVLAQTGDAIFPGSSESWGPIFLAFHGNTNGSYVLAGNTDNADPDVDQVVVVNGEDVVVREGDPVDVDGNGMFDDDAFIGRGDSSLSAFAPNDFFLTDDNFLYFIAPLRNGAGQDLGSFGAGGEAFLRLRVPSACSLGNIGLSAGTAENTITVNGSAGDIARRVTVSTGESITIALALGSQSPAQARYVLWVWGAAGQNPSPINALGSLLGCTVNPSPLSAGSPQPIFCVPGSGIPAAACGSASVRNISNFAPWSATKATGLQTPGTFVFQGIEEDNSSTHPSGFGVTNAVTLIVE